MILLVCGSWFEFWWLFARMAVGAGRFGGLVHYFDNFTGNLQTKTKATWVIEPLLRVKLIRKPQIFRLIWGIRGTDSVWTGQWRFFSVSCLVSWACERIDLPLVYYVYVVPVCPILGHLDPRHARDNELAHWFGKILHLNAMYHPKPYACAFAWHTNVRTLSTSNGWFRRSHSNHVPPSSIQYPDNSTKNDNKAKHNDW